VVGGLDGVCARVDEVEVLAAGLAHDARVAAIAVLERQMKESVNKLGQCDTYAQANCGSN